MHPPRSLYAQLRRRLQFRAAVDHLFRQRRTKFAPNFFLFSSFARQSAFWNPSLWNRKALRSRFETVYLNICRLFASSVLPLMYRTMLNMTLANRKLLISAVAFSFAQNGISDEEIQTSTDFAQKELSQRGYQSAKGGNNEGAANGDTDCEASTSGTTDEGDTEWTLVLSQSDFTMWRRPLADHPYVCEYKCVGTYTDVPAAAFFMAQVDLTYRREWDNLVISLDVIDKDEQTGGEVIRWVTHFPYPMSSREYLFVRRACVDVCQNTMAINTSSCEHPSAPVDSGMVRVDIYQSSMIIKPHTNFHEPGLDYVLTYCDDPKSSFPSLAYKWMVKHGVPGYLTNVHAAAIKLHARTTSQQQKQTTRDNNNNNSSNGVYETLAANAPLIYGQYHSQQL